MAVIMLDTVAWGRLLAWVPPSTTRLRHTPTVDVIGTERRPVPSAPPPAGLVGLLAILVLLAGVVAAQVVEPPGRSAAAADFEPVGPAVVVSLTGGRASPAGTGLTGELLVGLASSRDSRVRLGALSLTAAGLSVDTVSPVFGRPLGPRERREYAVTYRIASCERLRLPVVLRVSWLDELAGGARSQVVQLGTPELPFAVCPGAATAASPPDLAVRSIGGSSARVGVGARGTVVLEVRNAAGQLRLLSVAAQLGGVRFSDLGPPNGLALGPDDRVEVRLGFVIDDCSRLAEQGQLVLRVERAGVSSDLMLAVTADPQPGTVRQLALDRVLSACL